MTWESVGRARVGPAGLQHDLLHHRQRFRLLIFRSWPTIKFLTDGRGAGKSLAPRISTSNAGPFTRDGEEPSRISAREVVSNMAVEGSGPPACQVSGRSAGAGNTPQGLDLGENLANQTDPHSARGDLSILPAPRRGENRWSVSCARSSSTFRFPVACRKGRD